MSEYILHGLSLPYAAPSGEACAGAEKRLRSAGLCGTDFRIVRRSVDARKKDDIRFVYSVVFDLPDASSGRAERLGAVKVRSNTPEAVFGNEPLTDRPLICGFGPAGMFAALVLAENGYRPVVCERGPAPARRREKIERFFQTGDLDTEGNVQFGAGGAGMFSDGKLMTRINDGLCRFVLEKLHECGAPGDVLVNARPHIGTDLLMGVVEETARRIERLGGTVLYDTRVDMVRTDSAGRARAVVTSSGGEIGCGALILAFGHSAHDTYSMLRACGYGLEPKPIAVGFRIEHLRADIDRALYGDHAGDPLLGAAEYNLSAMIGGTGVFTFCMCPGGEVTAAASENGTVVTNGASKFARDGLNSNCAVALSIKTADPEGLQIGLERAAFTAGGGGFAAPVQTVGDFISGRHGTDPGRVLPTYTRNITRTADVAALLPGNAAKTLAGGLVAFGKKIKGFDAPDAIVTGLETRMTAPYRMPRGADRTCPGHDNVYPCGEGAGWAGGITSAAVDGVKTALSLMERFTPPAGD